MHGCVQEVPELLTGLEPRNFLRGHVDSGPDLWVPCGPRTMLAHLESSEPSELNLVPLHQGGRDALKDRLDDAGAFLLGQTGGFRQLVDQLRLPHQSDPLGSALPHGHAPPPGASAERPCRSSPTHLDGPPTSHRDLKGSPHEIITNSGLGNLRVGTMARLRGSDMAATDDAGPSSVRE